MTYYAITTFGAPAKRFRSVQTSKEAAVEQAATLKGSGTCSTVHVLAFAQRNQAAAAVISDHRGLGVKGETVAVF